MKTEPQPHLTRAFGLLHATALNISNMVGIGPFITIPLLMASMGGPQAMLGWVTGAFIVISDGLIWSELGAALPGSGGSYHFLREAYGHQSWGRLMAFLFIWQFVLSGPLEIASGMIGFGNYSSYLWPGLTVRGQQYVAVAAGLAALFLLCRQMTFLRKATITVWIGTVLAMVTVIVTGFFHFNAHRAFDFPSGAMAFNRGFVLGLGGATLIAVYNYLGYYDVCYIGDEVQNPSYVVPRSILYSLAVCCVGYLALHLALIGVVPWREGIHSNFIVSDFMEHLYGRGAAIVVTVFVLWSAFGAVFALLLGYSRIPYAAAIDGYFFRPFAYLHPTKNYPQVSLLVLGGVSIGCAFLKLDQLVSALITTRILVQFLGQLFAIPLLRRKFPDSARPYKMWFYPIPMVIAFFWVGIRFSHLGLALHQNRFIDAIHRRSGFLHLGEVESYLAVQQRKDFMIRHTLCGFLSMACVLIPVAGCLGSSDPSKASPLALSIEGLSVAVQPGDGTYEIRPGNGGRTILQARVAAEIDHKWVKSTDYPQHEISRSNFERRSRTRQENYRHFVRTSQRPRSCMHAKMYEGKTLGAIAAEVQNHTGKPVTIQSIRSVEAVGNKIIDLSGPQSADRILSDSFSEDWPPLQIYDLGKAPQGMHRAIGSQLIYNRENKQVFF